MKTSIVAFVVAAFTAILFTPLMRALAKRLGVLDRPSNARKIHKEPIPRLGGLAILLGTTAPLVGLYFYRNALSDIIFSDGRRIAALCLAALLVVLAGILDDVRGLSQRYRFATEIIAALFVYWGGFQIHGLFIPLLGHVNLGWLALPATVLWVVAVINAVNFSDGLDGLAAGTAVLAAGTLFLLALHFQNYVAGVFSASIAGAAFGFLLFNFHPATVYMGDTGSMFLGLVLAVASIGSSQKNATMVALLGPALALGLPIGDTSLRVIRRIILGQPWFPADRKHVHHRLLDLGLSHRNATLLLYAATGLFCLAALVVALADAWMALAVGIFVVGCVVFAVRHLGFAEFNRFAETRRRQRIAATEQIAAGVEVRLARLQEASSRLSRLAWIDLSWQETKAMAEELEIDELEWRFSPGLKGQRLPLAWSRPRTPLKPAQGLVWTPQEQEQFQLQCPLTSGVIQFGTLLFTRRPEESLPFSAMERLTLRLWSSALLAMLQAHQGELDARIA